MKTTEIFERVNLSEIVTNPANVRGKFDETSLHELAHSMQESGLINPLTLRSVGKNRYEIVCGERRYRAAQLLEWKTIPAYIMDVTAEKAQELCLIENIQREDISPVEEARAYKQLLEMTGEMSEPVTRTGKSESYIRLRLKLNDLIPELANLLNEGEINLGVASVICSYSDEIQQDVHTKFYNKESYNNWFNYGKEDVRKRIESNYTTKLEAYHFDLSECNDCPFNTANFSLFSEGCGKCTNSACLNEKNASYLLAEAIRIKQENPLIVLCNPMYGMKNETVIERLKLQEYEIQEDVNCHLYPNKPVQPELSDEYTEEEKKETLKEYENEVQEYNDFMEDLKEKEKEGTLTRYALIRDKKVEFQYQIHEVKDEKEELQKQLKTLNDKDKRNKELKVINSIKDTKMFVEQNNISITKPLSENENKYLYFFLLDSIDSKHLQNFNIEKGYLNDKQKIIILEQGLTEEQKIIIKRDFLLKKFNSAFGGSTISTLYMEFIKEHYPNDVDKIEKKYTEVYNKRFKKIKEQMTSIEKQLKKSKKFPKKNKEAA